MNTLAVHSWPGAAPVPQDGLFAILIVVPSGSAPQNPRQQRDAARSHIRLAAREALAAVMRAPIDTIHIASSPGSPPRVLLAGQTSSIGCSFSHEDDYALAAINLHGRIGADLMRMRDIPDWQAVARDYLGPTVSASLQTLSPDARPLAFTRAWTRREAALKWQGQQLGEWQSHIAGHSWALDLPVAGLIAHIHFGGDTA